MSLRAVVVMDYQNVHLTAHDVFDHAGQKHDSLIHPMCFSEAVVRLRNQRQREGHPHADLTGVHVFRGLPHTDNDWEQSRRCSAQADEWTRAGAHVVLRDLKYRFQLQADGRPATDVNGHKIPVGAGQEKGIDVLVALTCVRQSLREDVDLVILASRDTDLVPVLETLLDMRTEDASVAKIETASWFNRNAAEEGNYSGGQLRPTDGRRVWNTNLNRAAFEASRDRHDYT